MEPNPSQPTTPDARAFRAPRVLVATTAMLSFISFWRAAAIVLNDIGTSAFYAGGIAEQAFGKAAPWFILAIMLFSYAVRAVYVESCSMFVRGGVYRVVKEAMGGTLAKVSVSALMFDYILTAPISGVSAGQYLVSFVNELLQYGHFHVVLPRDTTAAIFAAAVTLYFWWQNVKGIPESSGKAMRIMYVATVMVVVMILWSGYTLWVRGAHLPPWPLPQNLHFTPEALGWLRGSQLLHTIGLIGIFIALGHSVLAMSGEETLAQIYREIEHPKLPNLRKVGFIIVTYSLLFTAGVSFFAVMIIPDDVRKQFLDNLVGGLAMNMEGPYLLRLAFHAFVVLAGILMLSGAVNTAIVGANGVLNRVAEDGLLADWFRRPHARFGTSYRILDLVVGLQLLAIVISRGDIYLLGEAYAFGVLWSFVMKGLAVLALRYERPGPREYRVPLNLRLGGVEIPIGLGLITLTLLAIAVTNLVTKQVATISGMAFTLLLFGLFTASERISQRRGAAHPGLDQFHLELRGELSHALVGVHPGNALVLVKNWNALQHLDAVLEHVNPARQDVVVLRIRLLRRAGSGEHDLEPNQLFSTNEQLLFTRVLAVAEKRGKTARLALVAANNLWDGMLRAAQNLQSSSIILGVSARMAGQGQARLAGLAWERLPDPKPRVTLMVIAPDGQQEEFYLGPHAPRLTPAEIGLLHRIWLCFSGKLGPEELHHHDIVHFALTEVEREITEGKEKEVLERFKQHLEESKPRRFPNP